MSDYTSDEAEIEASRAPLLDHLVELRQRLITCIIAFFAAFLVCFYFAGPLFEFLLRPFSIAAQLLALRHDTHASDLGAQALAMLTGAKNMFLALIGVLDLPTPTGKVTSLVFTAPLEFFFTKVKLAAFGAIILAFPVLAWQVYAFVAPGLYKRERRAFLPFLVAAPALFVMGAALVYYMIMPFVLWFSLSQQIVGTAGISVQLLPKVSDYFDLITTLVICFGLFFQLPVVLTLVAMAGLVSSRTLLSGWRFAVAGIVIAAAIVTPPDPISMTLLALPIILLYFISIGCVRLIEGRRAREDAAAAA
ncbi:twin-arginine translocase subunit TatC [Phenylobacterium soli]|uniref:Sec-independent protein translocase protein TatC n=1 Tax=Phenylobacterium soli TaxID=2170551 RepID=A0A328ALE2_9CAUL|nr:twin-arginine translocase subunit TatC [Phenylobacterium soli]RAK55732.1 twin-arginine translocase subunit TatC [Phenylobacterium soli]